jgi:hypothetical protein
MSTAFLASNMGTNRMLGPLPCAGLFEDAEKMNATQK